MFSCFIAVDDLNNDMECYGFSFVNQFFHLLHLPIATNNKEKNRKTNSNPTQFIRTLL